MIHQFARLDETVKLLSMARPAAVTKSTKEEGGRLLEARYLLGTLPAFLRGEESHYFMHFTLCSIGLLQRVTSIRLQMLQTYINTDQTM